MSRSNDLASGTDLSGYSTTSAINTSLALKAPLASPAFTGTPTGIVTGSIEDDAITLAKMAGAADGQVISYDGSGDPVLVGPGDTGQLLQSDGNAAAAAFRNTLSDAILEAAGFAGPTGVFSAGTYQYLQVGKMRLAIGFCTSGASATGNGIYGSYSTCGGQTITGYENKPMVVASADGGTYSEATMQIYIPSSTSGWNASANTLTFTPYVTVAGNYARGAGCESMDVRIIAIGEAA